MGGRGGEPIKARLQYICYSIYILSVIVADISCYVTECVVDTKVIFEFVYSVV